MVVDQDHRSQTLLVTISGHVLLPSSIAHPLVTAVLSCIVKLFWQSLKLEDEGQGGLLLFIGTPLFCRSGNILKQAFMIGSKAITIKG